MPTKQDLENAINAYKTARAEAQKYGDEVMQALQMEDLVSSSTAKEIFIRKRNRAIQAMENGNKAAQLADHAVNELLAMGLGD